MPAIFMILLYILIVVFMIKMILNLIHSDIGLLAKIVWLLVIISLPLLGASLYFITEKQPERIRA